MKEVGNWIPQKNCPGCGWNSSCPPMHLPLSHVPFGSQQIVFPPEGITIHQCTNCFLYYKSPLPSPHYLSSVYSQNSGGIWAEEYRYASEIRALLPLLDTVFDYLDVGPGNGDFFRAINNGGGRKSGLDIVSLPGMAESLSGEFIESLLDVEQLAWEGQPYDLVTAFDVFEHFYRPDLAFSNLNKLLKPGGILMVETGNAGRPCPQYAGIRNWWYTHLFEHHVFWTEKAIAFYADKFGFEVISFELKSHKRNWTFTHIPRYISGTLKFFLYWVSPSVFNTLARKSGKEGNMPRWVFGKDHFRAILKRK